MGWEQRNADFCKAQTDAQMAYIEAEREVDQLQAENDRLREEVRHLKKGDVLHVLTDQELAEQQKHEREMQASINALDDENAKLREEFDKMDEWYSKELLAAIDENKKLRELVRDMWEGYNDPRCEECHLKDTPTCADCPICAREASVIDRMRELGVVE